MNERDGLFEKLEDLLGNGGFPVPRLRPPRSRRGNDLALMARTCRHCGRAVVGSTRSPDGGRERCSSCGHEL